MKSNIAWECFIATLGIGCGLWLLISLEKISGTEFVALSLGFSIIGLIITFSAEVQEFSIAGNGVKLKELRSEAEKTIEELKQARTEVFRFLVQKSIEFSGGWGSSSRVDERVDQFVKLFEQVEKFDCIKELKIDLDKALNVLMVGQFNALIIIHNVQKKVGDIFNSEYKPEFLYIKFKDEMVNKFIEQQSPRSEFEYVKKDIIDGIQAFAKLYAIKVQLDNLET